MNKTEEVKAAPKSETKAERLAALEASQAKAREQFEREEAIAEAFHGFAGRAHSYPLYGKIGTFKVGDDLGSYSSPGLSDLATAAALAALYPAAPLVIIKDGCTSIRTAAHAAGLPDEKVTEERPICPWWVEIKPYSPHGGRRQTVAKLCWVAETPAGAVAVEVLLPLLKSIGRVEVAFNRPMNAPKCTKCELYMNHDGCGDVCDNRAGVDQRIKWGTGGPEYPNDFTLTWTAHGEEAPTPAEFVAHLIGKEGAKA